MIFFRYSCDISLRDVLGLPMMLFLYDSLDFSVGPLMCFIIRQKFDFIMLLSSFDILSGSQFD